MSKTEKELWGLMTTSPGRPRASRGEWGAPCMVGIIVPITADCGRDWRCEDYNPHYVIASASGIRGSLSTYFLWLSRCWSQREPQASPSDYIPQNASRATGSQSGGLSRPEPNSGLSWPSDTWSCYLPDGRGRSREVGKRQGEDSVELKYRCPQGSTSSARSVMHACQHSFIIYACIYLPTY